MYKKIAAFIVLIVLALTLGLTVKQHPTQQRVEPMSNTPSSKPVFIASASYVCDNNKRFSADFFNDVNTAQQPAEPGQPPVPTGSVQLTVDGQEPFILRQTLSADGGRYANPDESFVFWDKGTTALILENGEEKNFHNCTRQ